MAEPSQAAMVLAQMVGNLAGALTGCWLKIIVEANQHCV